MTTFAPAKNLAYALIDGGITAVATSFNVVSGGSEFPNPAIDGSFSGTIWNITDYESAYLDPNAEIVTVTGRSINAFTVTRGAESTSGVAHNTTNKTYAIALTFTAGSYNAITDAINDRALATGYTADRVLITSALGVLDESTVTTTELGYLTGVTSALQTQIDAKAPIASPTFTGAVTTVSSSTSGYVATLYNNTATSAPANSFYRARGTEGTPLQTLSGDVLGGFFFRGYQDSGGFGSSNSGAIRARATQDVTSANKGTELDFAVTPNGSSTRAIAMVLGQDASLTLGSTAGTGTGALYSGKIQIGGTAPTASAGSALTVNSSVTTGAAGSGSIILQGEVNKERIKIYSAGGAGGGGPLFNMFSFRGTLASPTATQNGDLLAGVSGGGYGATAFSGNQYVFLQYATENWTDTAKGCYTAFFTVPNGSTSLTGRLLLHPDGAVTLGASFGTGTGALYAGTAVFTTASTSLTGISLTHSGVIAGGQDGVLINCTGANTNANSSALYVLQSNASSTQVTARFTNLGSSNALALISAGGATLLSTQNTTTSTNFVKHFQWTKVGGGVVTLWISNGTDPNGTLSGTAGDVCFNCNSSLIKKCTGTTNWS